MNSCCYMICPYLSFPFSLSAVSKALKVLNKDIHFGLIHLPGLPRCLAAFRLLNHLQLCWYMTGVWMLNLLTRTSLQEKQQMSQLLLGSKQAGIAQHFQLYKWSITEVTTPAEGRMEASPPDNLLLRPVYLCAGSSWCKTRALQVNPADCPHLCTLADNGELCLFPDLG